MHAGTRYKVLALLLAASVLFAPNVWAKTPRILYVGDSWCFFMWIFDSLDDALEQAGMGQYCATGEGTALASSHASEWAANEGGKLDALASVLARNPSIDIVHLSLGGNDSKGRWRPEMTTEEENAMFDEVSGNVGVVVEFILDQRPDIRVAICSYDYVWASRQHDPPQVGDYTAQEMNASGLRAMQRSIASLGDMGPRVTMINNYGITQCMLGDPLADPPYGPGEVPCPGGPPDFNPFPGGDPERLAPYHAMLDPHSEGVHYNELGYSIVAENSIRQVYKKWIMERMDEIEVSSPNGGEQWTAGATHTITWDSPGDNVGDDVRVGLHRAGAFAGWLDLSTDNDGAFNWIIPADLPPGDDYEVRVQSREYRSIHDFSNAPFSVLAAADAPLRVTSPNGGEQWAAGTTPTITWESHEVEVGPYVRLGLHKGGAFAGWLSLHAVNDGACKVLIPKDLPAGSDYRIRVQSHAHRTIRDFSNGTLTVVPAPLRVTAPNGGEQWPAGSVQTIQWESHGETVGPDVRVGLHKGSAFLGWLCLRTGNDGAYDWIVPAALPDGTDYRVRVQSSLDRTARDYSDGMFALNGK